MIVVDASVIVKWFIRTEEFDEIASNILATHLNRKNKILIPDFLYYEVGNTFATKTQFPANNISRSLSKLYSFELIEHQLSQTDVVESTKLAKKHNTSVYDMFYAVLAKRHKCKLVTADRKFIEKTQFSHVIHISEYR